jgi:hypothetical protein
VQSAARKSLLIATTAEHYRLGEKGSLLNVYLFVGHGILYVRFCREFNANNKIRQTAKRNRNSKFKKKQNAIFGKKMQQKSRQCGLRISLVESEDTNDNPPYRGFYVGKSQRATHSTQKNFLLKIISSIDFEHF